MKPLPLLGSVLAAFALAAAVPLRATLYPFEQTESDLKPDPALHFGALPNGVRYAVMANRQPRDRASLRLLVGAGSLYEKADQQGLAHFLEHMAFKGSTHYPPGTLVETLQRMGMSFGADTNASTSDDRTLFLLELPDTKAATLEEGCRIFADYAGGLLLRPDQIEPERGVILSEKRDRDSIRYRAQVENTRFTFPESLLSQRQTIGLEDVIQHAPRDRFADFYDTWYRPDNIAVIAVGDFEPAAVEGMIRAAFGGLAPHGAARPAPDLGTVVTPAGLRVAVHPDTESAGVSIEIGTVFPYRHEPDTAAVEIRHLKRSLAFAMLNRRFEAIVRKGNAPFSQARASAGEEFNFVREASLQLGCRPENWKKAMAAGEQELRRALTYGFQPAELAEAVANLRSRLNQAVRGSATRPSGRLADAIATSILNREVFTSPAQDAALVEPALAAVTADDCAAALRDAWAGRGRNIFVSGNLVLDGAEQAVRGAYEASTAVAVEPPPKMEVATFPYTDFGPAGAVASRKTIDDLGITEIAFANGVKLNLKRTDFDAGRIEIRVRVGGGLLTAPAAAKPGIVQLASGGGGGARGGRRGGGGGGGSAFIAGGLGKLSQDELQRVLAGQPVGVQFQVGEDAFTFDGATDGDHLLLEMQLMAAYLTDPGYRPEAFRIAHAAIPQTFKQLGHTPEGVVQTTVTRMLAGGDPRFGMPGESELAARTFDDVKEWLSPQFAHGAMEIAVIGDFDPKAAVDAVARTFGALGRRDPRPAYAEERRLSFPNDPAEHRYTVETEIPKGLVLIEWPTTDARDAAVSRRLGMLTSILGDRLRVKIRNEMGGAYSPSARSSGGTVFPGYGAIAANLSVEPGTEDRIAQAVLAIGADLAKNGVTADELERAKNPAVTGVRQSLRTNAYWMGSVLFDAQEEPQRLDWARTRLEDVERIAKADVDALAARYLDPARAFRFIIVPKAAETRQ
jgi:zinc protease